MFSIYDYIIAFLISFCIATLGTPFIILFAKRFGFVDVPDSRKVHQSLMPRVGGLAIVIGATTGLVYLHKVIYVIWPILIGGIIILVIGVLDDKYTLSPRWKIVGQLLAACVVVFFGYDIDFIRIPFFLEKINLGPFGFIIAIFWIIGVTNAINLIDGLDGLASGVSIIAMTTILTLALINGQMIIVALTSILIGSTLGFLLFNFYPAKIFLGDTGSLFLGYCIATISLMGLYKSVTLFSLIIPIIILAIPIFDTFFAIIRRLMNKKNIFSPDKSHLHHRLLKIGFTHRQSVLIIYGFALLSGICAIIFSYSTLWGATIIIGLVLFLLEISTEVLEIAKNNRLNRLFKKGKSR